MNLLNYPQPDWAVSQHIRDDCGDLVEDICEHGIGHPNSVWLAKHGREVDGVHGCDGCCQPAQSKQVGGTNEL